MHTDSLDRFETSLEAVGVGLTRTVVSDFPDIVTELVDEPAVGTSLGFDGLTLDSTPVKTTITPRDLEKANTGVTPIAHAIAEYGTLVVESSAAGNAPVALCPPKHVGVVRESDVLTDVTEAIPHLGERFSDGGSAVFATGVSATGDMGALVEGVHGPKTVHVVLVEGL